MITQHEAEALLDKGLLKVRMANGRVWAVRRNGATQTWKTRRTDFSIPCKCGLRTCFRLTDQSTIVDGIIERIV